MITRTALGTMRDGRKARVLFLTNITQPGPVYPGYTGESHTLKLWKPKPVAAESPSDLIDVKPEQTLTPDERDQLVNTTITYYVPE